MGKEEDTAPILPALNILSTDSKGKVEDYINPSIAISEEFTDNVFESPVHKKSEFITQVSPGIAARYRASFWDWDLNYAFNYRHYAFGTQADEFTHSLMAKGNLRLIENLLFLDINDSYQRVSLNTLRDTTTESFFLNQTDQNILTLSPYFTFRPNAKMNVKAGYRYINTTYFGTSAAIDTQEHGIFISTENELSQKMFFTTRMDYSYISASDNTSYSRLTPTTGIKYEYSDKSFINLEGGYSWLFNAGTISASPYWNASLSYNYNSITASVKTGVTYTADPLLGSSQQRSVSGNLEKSFERGLIGISAQYSDVQYDQLATQQGTKIEISGNGKYLLSENLFVNLSVTGDKFSGYNPNLTLLGLNYPYRLIVGSGITYTFPRMLVLSLNYTYVAYRNAIDSSTNGVDVNRINFGVNKTF